MQLIPHGTDAHYLPSQKAGCGKCEKRYARGGKILCNTAVLVNRSLQLPDKSPSKNVAAKVFILQGGAEPLSSAPV